MFNDQNDIAELEFMFIILYEIHESNIESMLYL